MLHLLNKKVEVLIDGAKMVEGEITSVENITPITDELAEVEVIVTANNHQLMMQLFHQIER